jgi:hypothetical protein
MIGWMVRNKKEQRRERGIIMKCEREGREGTMPESTASQAFHVLDKLIQFCLGLTIFRLSIL